jgi:hypothetical protein
MGKINKTEKHRMPHRIASDTLYDVRCTSTNRKATYVTLIIHRGERVAGATIVCG